MDASTSFVCRVVQLTFLCRSEATTVMLMMLGYVELYINTSRLESTDRAVEYSRGHDDYTHLSIAGSLPRALYPPTR